LEYTGSYVGNSDTWLVGAKNAPTEKDGKTHQIFGIGADQTRENNLLKVLDNAKYNW